MLFFVLILFTIEEKNEKHIELSSVGVGNLSLVTGKKQTLGRYGGLYHLPSLFNPVVLL